LEALIEASQSAGGRQGLEGDCAADPTRSGPALCRLPRLDQIERLDDDGARWKSALADKVVRICRSSSDFEKKSKQVRGHGARPRYGPGRRRTLHRTLLSLGRTEKADKPYLIGVFGQGGSLSVLYRQVFRRDLPSCR